MTSAGGDEITTMGAAEIARRVAADELSCRQVVEAHIRRISQDARITQRIFPEACRDAECAGLSVRFCSDDCGTP